jgi:hypothetical protein
VMPEVQALPAWILAEPAAPNLYANEELELADQEMDIDPVLAAQPPTPRCPIHGLACPRLVPAALVEEEAEPMAPAAPSPQGSWTCHLRPRRTNSWAPEPLRRAPALGCASPRRQRRSGTSSAMGREARPLRPPL